MAAGDYLKVAAANLRRAAAARKSEAEEARRNIVRIEQEAHSKINDLGNKIKLLQVEMTRLEDDAQRTIIYNQIQKMQNEQDETRQNAERDKQQILNDAGSKEGDVNGLISQASDLERRAGQ